jgi:hypothetical protein
MNRRDFFKLVVSAGVMVSLICVLPLSAVFGQERVESVPTKGERGTEGGDWRRAPGDNGDSDNMDLVGRWAHGNCRAVASFGNTAYFANGGYLEIVDFSNPANPVELGRVTLLAAIGGIAVSGNYVYVANDENGLRIIDIQDPTAPFEAGFVDDNYDHLDVVVSGDHAYVAAQSGGVRIIDVSEPGTAHEVGFYDPAGFAYGVSLSGDYLYGRRTITSGEWMFRATLLMSPTTERDCAS